MAKKSDGVVPFPGFEDLSLFAEIPAERSGRVGPIPLPNSPAEDVQVRFRVTLDHSRPAVWRQVEVAGSMPLDLLHEVLCVVMGWENAHLHRFRSAGGRTGQVFLTDGDVEQGEVGLAESAVRLDQVLRKRGDTLHWSYDFGDGWEHTIKAERIRPTTDDDPPMLCLDGRNACPLEDCGGLPGHEEILDLLASDPTRADWPEHLVDWVPPDYDPSYFSAEEVNLALLIAGASLDDMLETLHQGLGDTASISPVVEDFLRSLPDEHATTLAVLASAALPEVSIDLVESGYYPAAVPADDASAAASTADAYAAAVRPWQVLLDLVGDSGLVLTGSGRLRAADLRVIAERTGFAESWTRALSQEAQVPPMTALRETAIGGRLVRRVRGLLVMTELGRAVSGDPDRLLTALASGLLAGRLSDAERAARTVLVLNLASGLDLAEAATTTAMVLTDLGWSTGDDQDIQAMDVYTLTAPIGFALDWMSDQFELPEDDDSGKGDVDGDDDDLAEVRLDFIRRAVWVPRSS